jgi:NitT/TauT family transport system substrate-binding protein
MFTRHDRGIKRLKELNGKMVGLTMGTNQTYFLDAMFQVNGVANDAVLWADLSTDAMYRGIVDGRLDAAVLFQPNLARIEKKMGDRVRVFYDEEVYAFWLILAGRTDWIDSHPDAVRSTLKTLITANQAIPANPEKARKQVGAMLVQLFHPEDYAISLDQEMLLALDDQTRWAMKEQLVKARPMPNYLDAMRYHYLESLLPVAVTLYIRRHIENTYTDQRHAAVCGACDSVHGWYGTDVGTPCRKGHQRYP